MEPKLATQKCEYMGLGCSCVWFRRVSWKRKQNIFHERWNSHGWYFVIELCGNLNFYIEMAIGSVLYLLTFVFGFVVVETSVTQLIFYVSSVCFSTVCFWNLCIVRNMSFPVENIHCIDMVGVLLASLFVLPPTWMFPGPACLGRACTAEMPLLDRG